MFKIVNSAHILLITSWFNDWQEKYAWINAVKVAKVPKQKEVQTTQLSFVVVGDFDAKSY